MDSIGTVSFLVQINVYSATDFVLLQPNLLSCVHSSSINFYFWNFDHCRRHDFIWPVLLIYLQRLYVLFFCKLLYP